jgi:2,5-diamino-6-(ribosylamino)-4(3H)-pyrimidinone 5'-phosphate reductase
MTTKTDRPHVLMMSEITADGKLTLKKGASSKILMKYMAHETELLLHETRAEYDAIMVGANTIRIDNSFLTVRYVKGKARSGSSRAAWQIFPLESNVLGKDAPDRNCRLRGRPADRIDAIKKKGSPCHCCRQDACRTPPAHEDPQGKIRRQRS